MKEYYSNEDIITNKLSTTSDDNPLITGGMLHPGIFKWQAGCITAICFYPLVYTRHICRYERNAGIQWRRFPPV